MNWQAWFFVAVGALTLVSMGSVIVGVAVAQREYNRGFREGCHWFADQTQRSQPGASRRSTPDDHVSPVRQ
jgi:hypothetical protein